MSERRKQAGTPQEATTTDALCALKRDNVEYGDFWMIIDELSVSLAHQKVGEPAKAIVTVPRRAFDKFVRWYTTGDHDMRKR